MGSPNSNLPHSRSMVCLGSGHQVLPWNPTEKDAWEKEVYVWAPPPAISYVAIELLRQAMHKHHTSIHIIIIPNLFYQRLKLFKSVDLMLFMPAKFPFWKDSTHEPIKLSFCFPYYRHAPWRVKDTPKLCEVARKFQAMWKTSQLDGWSHLH